MGKRVDIISDTHGRLSKQLMRAIAGADLVIHAGDLTSPSNWRELQRATKRIEAVQGNNDYFYDYDPELPELNVFAYEGLTFAVSHYRSALPLGSCDIGVCGHTHRPAIERVERCLVVNPGSPTSPRGMRGPTIARLYLEHGTVVSAKIVDL